MAELEDEHIDMENITFSPIYICTLTVVGAIYPLEHISKKIIDLKKVAAALEIDEVLVGLEGGGECKGLPVSAKKRKAVEKGKEVKKSEFFNAIFLLIQLEESNDKYANVKLYTNGRVHLTGCRSEDQAMETLNKIVGKLHEVPDDAFANPEIELTPVFQKIHMINSYFEIYLNNANIEIDNYKLHDLLSQKGITCTFESVINMGITFKKKCMIPEETDVTVCGFQTGRFILTGAVDFRQIDESYEYVTEILLNHLGEILM